ncbi:hypothetical protein TEA_016010 [Camellia sinensis var. sinensis]|uniref:non-specific serine/threonine protein kinase n=1 Tax=Camellia sinensis var. sinensis TaxID=542762 RepID=A0A4S4DBM9_CAMSN|nr:hypothetical protein TEA_016010 [Camellia sinensis var. sinensis]
MNLDLPKFGIFHRGILLNSCIRLAGASTKSDKILTDQTRSTLLDWPKRFHIINGISRGLLYLHQDSRLRIIHRDLKASNILLDIDMNPKISDFGMARSFRGNETEANTSKVVGTYGYISPEYAVDGLFSAKSNVFSFGILVLEIMSGKKNRGFYHPNHHLNLLGHHLFRHGNSTKKVSHSCYLTEVLRSIHAGLLCVQQSPEDRPSMSSVVLMFGGERTLPQAKQLGFFTERNVLEAAGSSSKEATEYAVDGLFSVKSNVFSFGVLVLEIMSGKKNKGFYHPNHHLNLLGHHLFRHGNSTKKVSHSCYLTKVLQSIHVGLLCVQQSPEDRPSMSSVVLMFGGERTLPQAKQLGFFTERNVLEAAGSSSKEATGSVNEITITLLNAR